MPTIKTQDLNGAALDWAVAKAEGHTIDVDANGTAWLAGLDAHVRLPQFSTDPAEGHPIIERERISLHGHPEGWAAEIDPDFGQVDYHGQGSHAEGPTALIAAMRCHVAARLGPTVDVPPELLP